LSSHEMIRECTRAARNKRSAVMTVALVGGDFHPVETFPVMGSVAGCGALVNRSDNKTPTLKDVQMKRRRIVSCGKKRLNLVLVALLALAWSLPTSVMAASCPPPEKLAEAFSKVFKREAKIIKVKESGIAGLCEVDMSVNNRNGVLYVDADGKFFVAGQIINIESGENLTQAAMSELNKMTPDDLKKLDELTAFTLGKAGKTFYYVTDPQCPYCKQGETVIKKLAEEGKISVKFLLFPLPMHKGADEQSIAIVCDNKGFEGLEQGYKSENQCPEGTQKVKNTMAFLQEKGISGTPVYIFEEGNYHSGLMQEPELLKALGMEPPAEAAKPTEKAAQPPAAKEAPKPAAPEPAKKQ